MTSKTKQKEDRAKIVVGKKYRNKHTGIVCRVSHKAFYNIAYHEVTESINRYPQYCHYKIFQKYWEPCDEINTPSMR